MYNKKGALGMTLTWMVGTLVIFMVLILFLFAVTTVAKTKEIAKSTAADIVSYAEKKSESAYFISEKNPSVRGFENLKEKIGAK